MKKILEVSLNVLVGVAALLVIYHLASAEYRSTYPPGRVAVGDRLSNIHALHLASDHSTLLLAVRKGCHFCEDSMPFYRRLVTLREQHRIDVQLVGVFPDDDVEARGVLREAGLESMELVAGLPLSKIDVTGTPTLLLVDKRGVVSRAWFGELKSSGEADVLKALNLRNP